MIFKAKKDGWEFFFTDEKFLRAFDEILDALERRAGTILGADTESRRRRLILKAVVPGCDAGTPFVLKREWFVFRFDRTLKSFLFGSNARSILKASDRADTEGFRDFCRTFFVAERSRLGVLRETVSVIEFLDGHSLDAEATLIDGGENGWAMSEATKREARELLENCHRHGIVSGDVHPGNFFRTKSDGRLKLIDFRGKKLLSAVAEARDRVQMERIMHIPDEKKDWGEKVFRAHLALRNALRRLRGRPPLDY